MPIIENNAKFSKAAVMFLFRKTCILVPGPLYINEKDFPYTGKTFLKGGLCVCHFIPTKCYKQTFMSAVGGSWMCVIVVQVIQAQAFSRSK